MVCNASTTWATPSSPKPMQAAIQVQNFEEFPPGDAPGKDLLVNGHAVARVRGGGFGHGFHKLGSRLMCGGFVVSN